MSLFKSKSKKLNQKGFKEKENSSPGGYQPTHTGGQSHSPSGSLTASGLKAAPAKHGSLERKDKPYGSLEKKDKSGYHQGSLEKKEKAGYSSWEKREKLMATKSSAKSSSGSGSPSRMKTDKSKGLNDPSAMIDEVFADAGIDLPPGIQEKAEKAEKAEKSERRRDRNMSISKSGRHKYKGKQRSSVLQDDVFGGENSPVTSPVTSPTGAGPAARSRTSGSGVYRDADSKRLTGGQRLASQPTAV